MAGLSVEMGSGTSRGFATLAASGAVVAGVAGKRIRLFAAVVSALIATNIKFQSNATDISGTFPLAATGGFVLPSVGQPWLITNAGEALNLNMSVATTVGIQVVYDVVE
jgi:hypothetical protein